MEDLPKKALSNVAEYLDREARALLAVALTAPSSSWEEWDSTKTPSQASKSVVSSPYHKYSKPYEENWDKLDLGDVNTSTANKLTDADVCGILVCTDAVNKLKRLWLTNCVSVCGNGLAPLHGSITLEYIDLSLAEYRSPARIDHTPMLSEEAVLPILRSIAEQDNNSLKYLRFPKAWREGRSKELGLFIEVYNRALSRRNVVCSRCDSNCLGTKQRPWVSLEGGDYGVQNFTCNDCMKHICDDCEFENDLQLCPCCEEKHCAKCAPVETCNDCHTMKFGFCVEFYTCDICDKTNAMSVILPCIVALVIASSVLPADV